MATGHPNDVIVSEAEQLILWLSFQKSDENITLMSSSLFKSRVHVNNFTFSPSTRKPLVDNNVPRHVYIKSCPYI